MQDFCFVSLLPSTTPRCRFSGTDPRRLPVHSAELLAAPAASAHCNLRKILLAVRVVLMVHHNATPTHHGQHAIVAVRPTLI